MTKLKIDFSFSFSVCLFLAASFFGIQTMENICYTSTLEREPYHHFSLSSWSCRNTSSGTLSSYAITSVSHNRTVAHHYMFVRSFSHSFTSERRKKMLRCWHISPSCKWQKCPISPALLNGELRKWQISFHVVCTTVRPSALCCRRRRRRRRRRRVTIAR